MSRRTAAALTLAVLACAAASIAGVRARPAAAAPLFAYELRAEARAIQVFQDDPVGNARNAEGQVPEARANLNTGPVGYGLASVAWPGPLAANAGSLILVASADAPPEVTALNYPVRAESRTGQNPPTTTYTQVPGVSLTSTAKPDLVSADASVANTLADTGTFGPARASGKTSLSGSSGIAESFNVVNDVVLGGGVVTIQSVRSAAMATTDGTKSGGKASTTVVGLAIGGQPATIDESGLRIGDSSQPLNEAANAAARQALADAGMDIVLSAPTKEVKGAAATLTAGSLVVVWKPSDSALFSVVLGGAQAAVKGAPGTDDDAGSLTGISAGSGAIGGETAATGSGGSARAGISDSLGGGGALTGVAGGAGALTNTGAVGDAAAPGVAIATAPASAHGRLIEYRELLVMIVLALTLGGLLKAMSEYVLAEKVAVVPCSLEDDS